MAGGCREWVRANYAQRVGNMGNSYFLSPSPVWLPLSNKQTSTVKCFFTSSAKIQAKKEHLPLWPGIYESESESESDSISTPQDHVGHHGGVLSFGAGAGAYCQGMVSHIMVHGRNGQFMKLLLVMCTGQIRISNAHRILIVFLKGRLQPPFFLCAHHMSCR